MSVFLFDNKTYEVDSEGFLLDFNQWDEGFAEGMAPNVNKHCSSIEKHWDVIHLIRDTYNELGKCPLVYQTCKLNGLRLKQLKNLFPTGYLRGACKLAGITYKEGYVKYSWVDRSAEEAASFSTEKTYNVDVRGFLVDLSNWDEQFAVFKAHEMKMPDNLTDKHWQIIHFLRNSYIEKKVIPTIYETCEANNIELDELERLFPDGYHRGAVKLAGLRVR